MLGGKNFKPLGRRVEGSGRFTSKLTPHIWGIVHVKLDKSPPLAPYASYIYSYLFAVFIGHISSKVLIGANNSS